MEPIIRHSRLRNSNSSVQTGPAVSLSTTEIAAVQHPLAPPQVPTEEPLIDLSLSRIEIASEASDATFPRVDPESSIKQAIWVGLPVPLKSIYKPFLPIITAESEDELRALRDIAFVQDELHNAHLKIATWQRKRDFLSQEIASIEITEDDKEQSNKCEYF